jgi:hypothetical protein
LFIVAWSISRKANEKYRNGRSVYISGRPIAGTVFASDPYNTPGLGWLP